MYSIVSVFAGLIVTCSARRVQSASGIGDITDAELGLLNFKKAMKDPSLFKETAQFLRSSEGSGELV
eukprot:CAMPEP_0169260186 /NCGR_PEP_ID=MMETSP1016-20121227/42375_1 /TAXON_ID=342587 /ORGANISM="Karlodinium micrum, Strain CCMP2283" /LENGTH=66 /DNA_ID=CAMNT_0009342299 /DNA_START=43 /DNA_END=239 /DNA_ORIENTATION=+